MLEDVLRDGQRRDVDLGVDYRTVRAVAATLAGSLDEVVREGHGGIRPVAPWRD
jgi:hypothetical protein